MENKLVSIIIPVYNGAKYLRQAIESAMKQSYKNIEVIVVDDGSTDNSSEIAKCYDVKYLYQQNQGPSAARNNGIIASAGEYIAFLDCDDVYLADKIERQVDFMINNDVDIVYNDCNIVDEELNFISRMRSEGVYEKQEDFYCMLLFRQIIPMPPSIMLKRKCFEDGYYYNTKYRNAEDYELIIRLAAIYKFGYLPEALYLYRRHEGNLTNNHKLQLKRELEVMNEIGLSKIHQIVQQSSFSENEKKMIYTKILVKMQEYIGAKEILEQLVLAECDNYSAWFYLGNCNYYLGDFPSAEKAYEKAIKFSPDMAEAYNNLACTIAHIDSHRSRELLDKAVTLKLNYMDAESNINTLKVGGKDFKITNRELRRTLTCYR